MHITRRSQTEVATQSLDDQGFLTDKLLCKVPSSLADGRHPFTSSPNPHRPLPLTHVLEEEQVLGSDQGLRGVQQSDRAVFRARGQVEWDTQEERTVS